MRAPLCLEPLATLPLSAASGLVLREGLIDVIGDDSLALHRYTLDGTRVGTIALLRVRAASLDGWTRNCASATRTG